jgi:hypothetical protein
LLILDAALPMCIRGELRDRHVLLGWGLSGWAACRWPGSTFSKTADPARAGAQSHGAHAVGRAAETGREL